MVVLIGVRMGCYDNDPLDKEFEGELAGLHGVKFDIENILKLFGGLGSIEL